VDLAAALAADLAGLSRALDQPDVDLETELRRLIAELKRAVNSYLGLRMSIAVEGRELSFTTFTDRESQSQIASSLMLPLTGVSGLPGGSSLILYAAAPGAFVDLAADLSHALQLQLSAVVLDQHLPALRVRGCIEGLRSWSDVNRAVGVLIGRGHTPESGRAELRRLAALDSGNLHHAAAMVLAAAAEPRG
jgi:hypothetical protein